MTGKRKEYSLSACACLWMTKDTNCASAFFNKVLFTPTVFRSECCITSKISWSRTLSKSTVSILTIYSTNAKSTHSRYHTLGKTEAAWDPAAWHGIQWLTRLFCYLLTDTEWVASSLGTKIRQLKALQQKSERSECSGLNGNAVLKGGKSSLLS